MNNRKLLKLFGLICPKPVFCNKYWVISREEYEYGYFTCSFLNDSLSLILYSVFHCHKPIISLEGRKNGWTDWDTFFVQPFGIPKFPVVDKCPVIKPAYKPSFRSPYNKIEKYIWTKLYRKYAVLNEETLKYVESERKRLIDGKKVLGVLARGTDYVKTQPQGHPRQPSVSQLIEETAPHMATGEFDYIYLATEEQKIKEQFENAFPGKILENKRTYYDAIYEKNNCELLWQVEFDRPNDLYLKGLEYLSSIYILSKCDALIAGNCGGSCSALYMNDYHYKFWKIFDLGYYN